MIRRLIETFSFPMLGKELREQAQQKRTYAFRFFYCLILYFFVLIDTVPRLIAVQDPLEQLGRGRELFDRVNFIQCLMIVIFMPIIASGAVAYEKERNTLQLLLLTRLSSWNIVFEKFLSRFLTIIGFQLMALPLMAVAYALGGLESDRVWNAFLMQLSLAFVIGALALACSSYCTTSFSALLTTFLLEFVFAGCSACIVPAVWIRMGMGFTYGRLGLSSEIFLWMLNALPPLIVGSGFLLYARNVLFDRATVQPTHHLLKLFHWLDAAFHHINQNNLTRGIEVIPTRISFPENDPVAWRERTHSLAGSPTHLMRLFSFMMIPLSVIIFIALSDVRSSAGPLGPIVVVLWIFSLLVVFISSTPLMLKEKSRQTLDVLLSVPLSSREILEQKRAGVARLITLFQLVLWILLACHIYMIHRDESWYFDLLIFVVLGLSHRLQLIAVSWLGLFLGAWQKHLVRALALGIIGIVFFWKLLPDFLIDMFLSPSTEIWYSSFNANPDSVFIQRWNLQAAGRIILSPLWITGLFGNYQIREAVVAFPASLLLSLAYQWGMYRLIRRWAFARSKRDLPRLSGETLPGEVIAPEEIPPVAQTSPEIGSP